MLALYELLNLLSPDFEPIFAPRLNKLCSFLLEHDQMKEKEAAEKYLGDIRRQKYFNNLKNELKKALTRYVIAYPSLNENHRRATFEECYRNFAAYKLLLINGKRKAAIEIAKEVLPKLRELEMYFLAHNVIHDLSFHHSSIDATPGMAKKYERLAEIYLEYVKAESMVRTYRNRVGYICNTRESYTPKMIEEFKEAVEHTLPLLRLGSHFINRMIYAIAVSRYSVVYDYDNIIKYCDEALGSFPKDHPNIKTLSFIFLHNKIPALIALGRLEEAKGIAKQTCKVMPVGSFNWHVALIKRVIVCFHAGDYQEAYELYKSYKKEHSTKSKSIVKSKKNLSKTIVEFWNILQGYLYFLIQRGKIEPYSDERFYLGKFINEMPIYSRDKAGNNINILLIQILIRLNREQFGHIIDRVESLNQYVRKYTQNPESKRANIFIKMIIKMEAAKFHRSGTELKTQKLVKRLNSMPLKIGQNLTIEIIPYSVLWEEILLMLEDKFRAKTVRKTSNS